MSKQFHGPIAMEPSAPTMKPGNSETMYQEAPPGQVQSRIAFTHPPSSKVEWLTETTYDFGDIPHRKPAKHEFRFRNVSGEPLVIDNVRPSCGCTAPGWDAAAVPPDSTGLISVEYDARDLGYFYKKIKVYFNGQGRAEVLYIEGWVE